MNVVCILYGGPEHDIKVGKEIFHFEMHPYCGPMPINKKTKKERHVGPRHKFWDAVTWWDKQGQRIDDAGLCMYRPLNFFEECGVNESDYVKIGKNYIPKAWMSKEKDDGNR